MDCQKWCTGEIHGVPWAWAASNCCTPSSETTIEAALLASIFKTLWRSANTTTTPTICTSVRIHLIWQVPEARLSNMKHRPIGLGVQGLADAFIHMRLPFDSEGARLLNKEIFETM